MDEIRNPFSPGAGTPPPALTGRADLINTVHILLSRVKEGRPAKSVLMVGLRGVGKTVLLNELEALAQQRGYKTLLLEAHENKSLVELLAPPLRKLLFQLDRMENASLKVRRGLRVLKSIVNSINVKVGNFEIGLDIEPERGTADSGDLEADLPDLFLAVAEAAQERNTGVALLLDEIQYLSTKELSALIMAMHKMAQKKLPFVLIGAGLPILPGLAGESKSYAERLFEFPEVGPLLEEDARRALREPVQAEDVDFTQDALDEILRSTQGYPYFLQEWGYQCWNHAPRTPIQIQDVKKATKKVMQRLDANFFRVRFDRLTPREKEYLRALAELGAQPQRSGDVAAMMGAKVQTVAPIRDILMKKGMIYSPAHGDTAFTVPLFDQFMKRAMPEWNAKRKSDE